MLNCVKVIGDVALQLKISLLQSTARMNAPSLSPLRFQAVLAVRHILHHTAFVRNVVWLWSLDESWHLWATIEHGCTRQSDAISLKIPGQTRTISLRIVQRVRPVVDNVSKILLLSR